MDTNSLTQSNLGRFLLACMMWGGITHALVMFPFSILREISDFSLRRDLLPLSFSFVHLFDSFRSRGIFPNGGER